MLISNSKSLGNVVSPEGNGKDLQKRKGLSLE